MADRTVTLAVIITLGLVAVATVVGGIVLAIHDRTLPGELIAIGASACSSVGMLLARAPKAGPGPEEGV